MTKKQLFWLNESQRKAKLWASDALSCIARITLEKAVASLYEGHELFGEEGSTKLFRFNFDLGATVLLWIQKEEEEEVWVPKRSSVRIHAQRYGFWVHFVGEKAIREDVPTAKNLNEAICYLEGPASGWTRALVPKGQVAKFYGNHPDGFDKLPREAFGQHGIDLRTDFVDNLAGAIDPYWEGYVICFVPDGTDLQDGSIGNIQVLKVIQPE